VVYGKTFGIDWCSPTISAFVFPCITNRLSPQSLGFSTVHGLKVKKIFTGPLPGRVQEAHHLPVKSAVDDETTNRHKHSPG